MSSADLRTNRDNYCYRHPDRQSFVLCQRCLRTICPQCQTQAAVGVICPDCMAEQRRSQSPAQRSAQRRASRRSGRVLTASTTRPVMTYAILAITAVFFVAQLIPGSPVESWLFFYAPALYPT